MAGYNKEFLIDAFMSRYITCTLLSIDTLESMEKMASDLYDQVGRDKFRVYASLDAEAIKEFKNLK
jgi:hypothetical protein